MGLIGVEPTKMEVEWGEIGGYPLVMADIVIENHHF